MIRIAAAALVASIILLQPDRTAEAQPGRAPPAACAPAPALALVPGFRDPRGRFRVGSPVFQATVRTFERAWQRSCASGVVREVRWPRLYLRNAPNANVASIYRDPDARMRLTLEYPFVTPDGSANAPGTDELTEAIYCHVRGATRQEQEASGRCLVD